MCQEFDLTFLRGLERDVVLQVLHRDETLRKVEEERIRNLKEQLQQVQEKEAEAKRTNHEYQEGSCARCQRPFGILINRGAVCNGCSHQVCARCRITVKPYLWKCTVCYAYEDIKVKSGEWFFEERAKKFPAEGRHETVASKLLKSYQKPSNISVVPPTPPPFAESSSQDNAVELDQSTSFHRSLENLFLSFTSHIKKISKSQNDVTADQSLLTADYGLEMEPKKERRSQSDTAIDISSRVLLQEQQFHEERIDKVKNDSNLQRLLSREQDGNVSQKICSEEVFPTSPLNDTVFSSGVRRISLHSINSTCTEAGNFDKADVSGEIEFAIRYAFKFNILEVCIGACRNLAYGDNKKKKCNPTDNESSCSQAIFNLKRPAHTDLLLLLPSPTKPSWKTVIFSRYVKTCLLPDKSSESKRKTTVKKNTVDPTFREILKYKINCAQLETRQLQVSVWHAGTFTRKVFLGEVVLPLESWDFEDRSTKVFTWYELKAKPERSGDSVVQWCGELLVHAKLVSPSLRNKHKYGEEKENTKNGTEDRTYGSYQLHLLILEAKNLSMTRSGGLLNSFVKGCLCLLGRRDLKQRTPVLKKQAQPQWNHLFVFSGVTLSQLQQSFLDLTVWDQASFSLHDQFLGGARLGKQSLTSTVNTTPQACYQWEKMLTNPDTWTEMKLALYPNNPEFKF